MSFPNRGNCVVVRPQLAGPEMAASIEPHPEIRNMSKTKNTAKKASKANAKQNGNAKPAKEKKLSAIDAAAQVLSSSKEPMNSMEMIEAMAAKKLWTSPGG